MFVIYEKDLMKYPIKVWLESKDQVEASCLEQAMNLANLPFLHKWVSLMPDTHTGMGMPIGGVIATDGVIIPNAVGVDIGCGMAFVETNIPAELLKNTDTPNGKLIQPMIGDILRNIPVGFAHHQKKQECSSLDEANIDNELLSFAPQLLTELERGYFQIGTLGGGNHFIEIQEDDDGIVGLMIHSGSRNFGFKICRHFNGIAREMNDQWHTAVPEEFGLSFLPVDTPAGRSYIEWMNLALNFAHENREHMMERVIDIVGKWFNKYSDGPLEFKNTINCHHNYAAIEHHYGKNVWVHRKGAIRARDNDVGIIPGAMGSYSYIVNGLGCEESFHSCSHGAGRKFSRTKAKEEFSVEKVINDLKKCNVVLGKHKKDDVAEECRFAYKDIDFVIKNELDLVKPVKRLKTIGVIKG
jgi:tRNA-splicing ligase RtcB